MKILDKSFDFSHILGGIGLSDYDFGIGDKLEELMAEGYDQILGTRNTYGFPRFVYALKSEAPEDVEYLQSSAYKEDMSAGFFHLGVKRKEND